MATRRDIEFPRGDDPTASFAVTRDGSAFSLTGRRVEVAVYADRDDDLTAVLYQLSSVGGTPKVTVTDAAGGLGVIDFADRCATAGVFWYRAWTALTADAGSDRQTFNYGELRIDP